LIRLLVDQSTPVDWRREPPKEAAGKFLAIGRSNEDARATAARRHTEVLARRIDGRGSRSWTADHSKRRSRDLHQDAGRIPTVRIGYPRSATLSL
jgi:hypothetical protein